MGKLLFRWQQDVLRARAVFAGSQEELDRTRTEFGLERSFQGSEIQEPSALPTKVLVALRS